MEETVTLLIQLSHFNHFQTRKAIHLAERIIREGHTANLQDPEFGTFLQTETSIWIELRFTLRSHETVLPNYHSLQLAQSNQQHFLHISEAIVTRSHFSHIQKHPQIQHPQFIFIAAIRHNHNHFYTNAQLHPIGCIADYCSSRFCHRNRESVHWRKYTTKCSLHGWLTRNETLFILLDSLHQFTQQR